MGKTTIFLTLIFIFVSAQINAQKQIDTIPKKASVKQFINIVSGDKNTIINGNLNQTTVKKTVINIDSSRKTYVTNINSYDIASEKPNITLLTEKVWPNKEFPPFPNCPLSDSMYKTTIDFQYYSHVLKDSISIIVENEPSVQCVHVFYAGDQVWQVERGIIQEFNRKGVIIWNPKNAKFTIAIFSQKELPDLTEKLSIYVDQFKYRLK